MKRLMNTSQFVFYVYILVIAYGKVSAKGELPKFKTTASNLQYAIISKGRGPAVIKSHRLYIRYTTKLNDDTVIFDRSNENEAFKFIVGEREGLKGWDEALLLLNVGDSAIFRIPPGLAFGNKKVGSIPANSFLVFAVKVLQQEQAYYNLQKNKPIQLDSGLVKYEIHKATAINVNQFWEIEMNFTGYIKDQEGNRRIFESSMTNSRKAVFQLGAGKMVKGLEKGIATMGVGDKATFEVAPYLAFGNEKNGLIPPNSTLYFDIEIIRSYNPFYSHTHSDTLFGSNDLKILFKHKSLTEAISEDQVAVLHAVSYFFNNEGNRVLINSTRVRGEPISVRAGAKTQAVGFNKALKYLHKGDSATLIIPITKDLNNGAALKQKWIYYDVEILDVKTYPFFEIKNRDTIYAEKKLKYFLVRQGNGSSENDNCELTIAYTGYRIDDSGKKIIFDASRESGQLLKMQTGKNAVIPGFEIGIKDMKLGEARTLLIPPDLGYGSAGLPAAEIPPGTTLYFDVELIHREKLSE